MLIDGRTVYTPLFSGVFWDAQDVMLEDVERIEVISGPGGTLWGANAVNGVINVITKSAAQTQGGLASLQAGTGDQSGAIRYGGRFGERGSFRVYGMGLGRGDTYTPAGADAHDDWRGRQAGFRMDWQGALDAFTVQGDLFSHEHAQDGELTGGNLLGRWTHALGEEFECSCSSTTTKRSARRSGSRTRSRSSTSGPAQFPSRRTPSDRLGRGLSRHRRQVRQHANAFVLDPDSDVVEHGNLFLQDSLGLTEDLTLTLGPKFEYSSFSGFESLPVPGSPGRRPNEPALDRRLARRPHALAHRSRSRRSGHPRPVRLEIGEAGRLRGRRPGQPTAGTYLSVSLYYNDYDDLRALTFSPGPGLLVFDMHWKARSTGLRPGAMSTSRPGGNSAPGSI